MLETIVSSKVRRTLLEYLLTHPNERFYLRGLAKKLNLTISPLRRELKKLENSDMLKSEQEGNILFYTVNTNSSIYGQLVHAESSERINNIPEPTPLVSTSMEPSTTPEFAVVPLANKSGPPSDVLASVPSVEQEPKTQTHAVPTPRSMWTNPLSPGVLVAVTVVGLVVVLTLTGVFYMSATYRVLYEPVEKFVKVEEIQADSGTSLPRVSTPTDFLPQVSVPSIPKENASGKMRSNRWQLSPGGFGSGFGAGAK